jgi:hypothetical protein
MVGDLKTATGCRESQRGDSTIKTDELELVALAIDLNCELVAQALHVHVV